jgi:hypothetical protein
MVLFKNPRDAGQFANLAGQMYPNSSKFAVEAYMDATSEAYGYLFVDLKPEQGEVYRLRTGIFSGDVHYVYVSKDRQDVAVITHMEQTEETSGGHILERIPKFRRCSVCSSRTNNKRSRFQCSACLVPLCTTPCFALYHK